MVFVQIHVETCVTRITSFDYFSRVPCIGERVMQNEGNLKVTRVVHFPASRTNSETDPLVATIHLEG